MALVACMGAQDGFESFSGSDNGGDIMGNHGLTGLRALLAKQQDNQWETGSAAASSIQDMGDLSISAVRDTSTTPSTVTFTVLGTQKYPPLDLVHTTENCELTAKVQSMSCPTYNEANDYGWKSGPTEYDCSLCTDGYLKQNIQSVLAVSQTNGLAAQLRYKACSVWFVRADQILRSVLATQRSKIIVSRTNQCAKAYVEYKVQSTADQVVQTVENVVGNVVSSVLRRRRRRGRV